jgi:hypothetical protein
MEPIYRLLHETGRMIPVRHGLYRGRIGVEFSDVCAIALGVEIAAIRPDLAEQAIEAQKRADDLSFHYYRWHYV